MSIIDTLKSGAPYVRPARAPRVVRSGIVLTITDGLGTIERLEKVFAAIKEYRAETADKILHLDDNKGWLSVEWSAVPSRHDRQIVEFIWGSPIAKLYGIRECGTQVSHSVVGTVCDLLPVTQAFDWAEPGARK
jgi:hypothetical protein